MSTAVRNLPDGRTWNGHDFVHDVFTPGCRCHFCTTWLNRPYEQLLLFRESGVWCVRYTGPYAVKVRQLFGTDVLPTAYESSMPYQEVRAIVEAAHTPTPNVHLYVGCRHMRTSSKPGVGVVTCHDCGQMW